MLHSMKLCLLLFVLVVAFAFNEALDPNCHWDGSAPICDGSCTIYENRCRVDSHGDGKKCLFGQKALCCKSRSECSK
uniref:Uncharacterized protein n=1 Tax=Strigamia maritima TaxID=126957 RepID=T1IYS7_STRMM